MISAQAYAARRQQFMAAMLPGSVAIIPAAKEVWRNHDNHYPFRQQNDFYYLTGFTEPDAVAVFIPQREQGRYILFNRRRDPAKEQWTGKRAGQAGACDVFGADEAYPIETFAEELPRLLQDCRDVYYPFGQDSRQDEQIINVINVVRAKVRSGIAAPQNLHNIADIVYEMRLIKSDAEIALMRKGIEISAKAHSRAMQTVKNLHYEYEVEAELAYEIFRQGCRAFAYSPIVASGANACILHYIDNDKPLAKDSLLLIDAGGEYHNYAADITRTFPISGKFTKPQRAIYDLVLKAQLAGIEQVQPGNPWHKIQETIIHTMTEGLVELGILKGNVEELIADKAYQPFYMHNSGHWLGLDTHDVGAYKKAGQWRKLEPGMVLTVEPGIYITANMEGVDSRWWNIGVRIEDDVLVTPTGYDILSADGPKHPDEIEALMAK